jgi:hypothetical protein
MQEDEIPQSINIYTLTDDDIDRIDYQVRDVTDEAIEKASQNKKNYTSRCRNKLTTLQQLLEAARITPECRSDEGPSTSPTGEAGATTSYFSKMETGCTSVEDLTRCD